MRIVFNGSFFTVYASNLGGARWIARNLVVGSWQRHGDGVAVDHRCIDDIIAGARADGVRVIVK